MAETNTEVVAFLKEQVTKARIPNQTVIKFDRELRTNFDVRSSREYGVNIPEEGKVITYAAIFADNRWYFTGKGRLGNEKLTTRDLIERLSQDDIFNIQVAGDWTPVEDEEPFAGI